MKCYTMTVDVIYYNDESEAKVDVENKMEKFADIVRDYFDADMVEVEEEEDE